MIGSVDGSVGGALVLAAVLGARHALDPDHLVAVSTLIAGSRERGARSAARLAAAWGAGHGLTLLVFGLPVLLLSAHLPELVQQLAEAAIGVLIVALAVQLLVRWRRGAFHLHVHEHSGVRHAHVHSHARTQLHRHDHRAVRSPLAAFLIGCVHGTGGSAAVVVLVLADAPGRGTAVMALAVLSVGAAVSMVALSTLVGFTLGAHPVRRRLAAAIPAAGTAGLLFGAWYALAAWHLLPYPL
jgi:ABC-type nickel/cobalt efflux system permease component RcnA